MNRFDLPIIHFLNLFSQHSWLFDNFVGWVAEVNLTKGGIAMALFWWAWFYESEKPDSEKREYLIFAFFSSCLALLVAQTLIRYLPYRQRPLLNPGVNFTIPFGVQNEEWHTVTSFPSDHAAMFFCLAATLWIVSRRLGIIAMCHALLVVSLPRVYLGFHYPTDILAGALIGIVIAFSCEFAKLREKVARPFFWWLRKDAPSFYAFAFLMTFQYAELFWSARNLLGFLFRGMGSFLRFRGPA
jgi:undecaprenyl-diphosphatase